MSRPAVIEPVVKTVEVELPSDEAFALFTTGMGEWWPLESHSIAADTHEGRVRAETVVFEGRAGGRIFEKMSDGTEGAWGVVLVWEPPRRVVFSWRPSLEPRPFTEVEVRFTALPEGTRVELEHRGWERLGAAAADHRAGYLSGWVPVMERFRSRARGAPRAG
jgi:uncharacterized protein YndB with AHSA1/START domain